MPRSLFLVKGPFRNFFPGDGGRGAFTWTNICVLKMQLFVQAIIIFLNFITDFFTFLFLNMYLQLSIQHCIVNKIPTS